MAKPSRKSASEPVATLRFWGVRGSTPTVDKATWRYGGNTACVELTTPQGARVILDCGTGLRMLGRYLESEPESSRIEPHIFVTHYHWDHIQGIPFFSPLYVEQNCLQFYSFRSEYLGRDSLKRVFEAQMAHPYFPVDISAMSARRNFTEVAGGDQFDVPGARVKATWLHHPQALIRPPDRSFMPLTTSRAIPSSTRAFGNSRRARIFSSTTRSSLPNNSPPRARGGDTLPGSRV